VLTILVSLILCLYNDGGGGDDDNGHMVMMMMTWLILVVFRKFSEETPGQLINQFPFEMVLTVKSVLPLVCRRGFSPVIDAVTLESSPRWLPTTFNLRTELAQFVSYFQHREKR